MYASKLPKLELYTVGDLIYHIPHRYDNFTIISPIGEVQSGEIVTIQGKITAFKNQYTRSRVTLQKATLADETGEIELVWFNQPFLSRVIKVGDTMSIAGNVEGSIHRLTLKPSEYEVISEGEETIHTGRLVPIYSQTTGITSKWLRKQIYSLLHELRGTITDFLPDHLRERYQLLPLEEALWKIHFPSSLEEAEKARERLAFDELFLMQTKALERRKIWETETHGAAFSVTNHQANIEKLKKSLPFELTHAQQKALDAIFVDVAKTQPMNRLVQGDVGSGKTIVAGISMYLAHLNGFQSVLMAPTEILAQQHYKTISTLLAPFGVTVDLVTSSQNSIKNKVVSSKKDEKNKLDTGYTLHDTDILIGTHAVLSEKISFTNLGLVVIDEQQRFGVAQRGIIRNKGNNPHLLTMTATPIPRTVALTMYGDLDLSYLDEMPKGRKVIKTWFVPPEKRDGAYEWIEKEIKDLDSQAFIICPFIEESESNITVKAATKEFERLAIDVFPHLKLGMLHGRQKAKEKEQVLNDFKEKKFEILVATPVVEVGIDIPNATVIMIEAADRFGLAQLHQLRGRVGRGDKQSYCLLFSESTSQKTSERLHAMERTNIGAELSELDLRLRGPGDIYGTSQHGAVRLKVASFSDFDLIEKAKAAAVDTFEKITTYPLLKKRLDEVKISDVSPD